MSICPSARFISLHIVKEINVERVVFFIFCAYLRDRLQMCSRFPPPLILEAEFWDDPSHIHAYFVYIDCEVTLKILEFILNYNPGQSIWSRIEKSSKTGQDKKSLMSTFACFLTATAKV